MAEEANNGDRFLLDDRPIEWHLDKLALYSAIIPFGDSETGNWQQVLKANGVSDTQLVRLYHNLQQADGNLVAQQAFLLTFLHLLETPRRLLNDIPSAHRQFYYRDLLQLRERPAVPDNTIVQILADAESGQVLVPQGTLLAAGQTREGSTLNYQTASTLLANAGQLAWCGDYWPGGGKESDTPWLRTLYQRDTQDWSARGARLFTEEHPPVAEIYGGRAISSPALWGNSGLRQFRVEFESEVAVTETLRAEVSSDSGWLSLDVVWDDEGGLVLSLDEEQPATSSPNGLDNYWDLTPVLRIRRRLGQPLPAITSLTTKISGATHVAMSTDDATANPMTGGYPFGGEPTLGRGINLIAPEWGNGALAVELAIEPQWLDLPNVSFPAWYQDYPQPPENNTVFKVQPILCDQRGQENQGDAVSLFAGEDAPQGEKITVKLAVFDAGNAGDDNPVVWRRWLRLELRNHDFLHRDYIQQLVAEGEKKPNPPYTPQMSGLRITSTCTDGALSHQYILTPLGYREATQPPTTDDALPQLLLGIRDIKPGQMLSLYWRLWGVQPFALRWQYLSCDNQWHPLDFAVSDSTEGLFYSDLWRAVLPQDIARDQPWMPAGLCWVRALFPLPSAGEHTASQANTAGYPRLSQVLANAVRVRLDNSDRVDNSHFAAPLPAHTITTLTSAISGVRSVNQPWPTEGGVAAEDETRFFQRTAQRLRHRERVITRSDMIETLLAQFPELYQVRWGDYVDNRYLANFMVLPRNGHEDNDDPLRPLFSPARLQRMTTFLQQRTSPWVNFQLHNPQYVEIDLRCRVRFQADITPDFGYDQLRQALEQHYMPWAYDGHSSVYVGEQLGYYDILAFIQRQAGVENVEVLQLTRQGDGRTGGHEVVLAPTEVGILNIGVAEDAFAGRRTIR